MLEGWILPRGPVSVRELLTLERGTESENATIFLVVGLTGCVSAALSSMETGPLQFLCSKKSDANANQRRRLGWLLMLNIEHAYITGALASFRKVSTAYRSYYENASTKFPT